MLELPMGNTDTGWSTKAEVDALHKGLSTKLFMMHLYPQITWGFSNRFTKTYGQAEFVNSRGEQIWHIKYSSRHWLLLSAQERKNLITHEFCHLAVEYHYGYNNGIKSHGVQWINYMKLCGEEPFMLYADELQGSSDEDIQMISSLLIR